MHNFYYINIEINSSEKSMINLVEMDEKATLSDQMEENVSNVILINKLTVKPEDVDGLLRAWAADAAYFKQQPGFISTQLHRGIGRSCVFINYAVWESTELYKRAFKNPEFQPHQYPPSAVASPHLFKKVAVHGICVD
jgi:heme-degrading monooxygenase HmoA